MGKITPIYQYYTLTQGDIVYPVFDERNMMTTDNSFGGLYGFVGPGIIEGWEVTKLSSDISYSSDLNNTIRLDQIALIDAYNDDPDSYLGRRIVFMNMQPVLICAAATTVNIGSFSGLLTIDGVLLSVGDIVLVKNQTTKDDNGIYVVSASSWSRHASFNTNQEFIDAFEAYRCFWVESGTENQKTIWNLNLNLTGAESGHIIFQNTFEQCVRVTIGNGIVGPYRAYTEEPVYFRYYESNVYYIWASNSPCLATEGKATIISPLDPDYNYNLYHTATYLASVQVGVYSQPSGTSAYVDLVEYDDRRNQLKNLAGAFEAALRRGFYKHIHLGGNNHPSKINLSTNRTLIAKGPIGSTVFLTYETVNGIDVRVSNWTAANYGFPEVRLNNAILPTTAYYLDPAVGKIYLKNSLTTTAFLQIILPLSPQVNLYAKNTAVITAAKIALTDGSTNSSGQQNTFRWDTGLYLDPVVYLDDVVVSSSLYAINSGEGTISFSPALSSPYTLSSLRILLEKIGREITGILSGTRLKDVSAGTFTKGIIDPRRIAPLDHVGQARYLEPALLQPYKKLLSAGDHQTFYPELTNQDLQYTTEVFNIAKSSILNTALYQTKRGLMASNNPLLVTLSTWNQDNGEIIDFSDDLLRSSEGTNSQPSNVTYVLTAQGKVFFTEDQGSTWQKFTLPIEFSGSVSTPAFATAILVSTNKESFDNNGAVDYKYSTTIYLGTTNGLYTAFAYRGTEFTWTSVWESVAGPKEIYAIAEIVTQNLQVQNGVTTENYDRTIYIGSDKGFSTALDTGAYSSSRIISAEIPKGFLWIRQNSPNDLLWFTDTKVYISHTARLFEEQPDQNTYLKYWYHPLQGWSSASYAARITVNVATTTNLSAVYNNGTLGVGATLTNSAAQAALKIDNVELSVNNRVLIKNQTNQSQNGIYTVTTVGNGSTNWVLTRYASMTSTSWVEVLGGESWVRSIFTISYTDSDSSSSLTYGTDPISFYEFWVNPILLGSSTYPFKDAVERIGSNQYAVVSTNSPWILTDSKVSGEYSWSPTIVVKSNWDQNNQGNINTVYHHATRSLIAGTKEGIYLSAAPDNLIILILTTELAPADTQLFVTEPNLLVGYTTVEVISGEYKEILTIDVNTSIVDGITSYTIDITSARTSTNTYNTIDTDIYIINNGYRLSHAIWNRPVNLFNTSPTATVYYEDRLAISSDRTTLEGLVSSGDYTLNTYYQSVKFSSDQTLGQSFILESDYLNYYTSSWYSDADVIVYINDEPANKIYSLYPTEGRITFASSLTADDVVKLTIIKLNAFISNVGDTPHAEQINSLVSGDAPLTVLAFPLGGSAPAGTGVTVSDPLQVPFTANFLEFRNSNLNVSEFLQVKVEPDAFGSRIITLLRPRSSSTTLPITTTAVYEATLQNVPGIEDKISLIQSNQPYHLNSIAGSNLLQLSITANSNYNNLFTNFTGEPDPIYADKSHRGPVNSLFYDFAFSEADSRNSSSNLFVGLEPSSLNVSSSPRSIYIMNNANSSGTDMRLGTDKGIWIYNGSYWVKESALDNANKVYFISTQASSSYLMVGTDIGLYEQQSDDTWALNPTYPQAIYAYLSGSWDTNYTFYAYGKNDGLAFVRQGTGSTSFISDHFNDLDGSNVYGLYSNKFYRFVGTGDNRKQTQVDGLYLCTNVGLYAVCTGNASSRGEFASILVGREMFGSNPNTVVVTTPNGNTLTVPVKYYKIFQSPRPKSVPLIILSSNGVYTVRNWRWCDPDNSQEDLKDFVVENHSLVGISCNCFATSAETISTGETLYKIFVGTNKGVYRSIDEAKTFEKCERINGSDLSINDLFTLSSTCLLAATDNGMWYSNDDGDTWYHTDESPETGLACTNINRYIDNSESFGGGKLGQTFIAETSEITKVSLFLSRKEVQDDATSLDNTLEVAIYNTSGGLPTGMPLATTASTTNSVNWAPGYQASSGFNSAPRLYDNDIYDTSTYYESTSSGSSAGITAKYDFGLGNSKPVNKIIAKIYYTQDPTVTFEYSDDNSTWTTATNATIDPPIHAGSGRWESILSIDLETSSHRYWRLSVSDGISDILKTRVARISDFRLYYIDQVIDIGKLKQHLLPEKFTAADISYPGFKSFIINVTGLTPGSTYALVATESVAVGGSSVINWVKSNIQGY